ncbi:4a-hydroxytetrahydrobiopterin dehydratase [Mycobacterium sp. UM_Kg1]|uniref:4a-hydroxytetrahydrobiopterin dehydratase n=1 Tax=Mycobacterium sp. UM_Kg1 TaxID=1545691 RepID=UPI00061AF6E3|nr:4a-hydroxytetrahydrobiopterin dehydratase [Mycobacterium sp. UM_Kg1]
MALLTDDQINEALPGLPGWEHTDGALRRTVKFGSFPAGIEAVRRVAQRAEAADHHPDIDIRWRTVTFVLVTHSAGGITDKDVAMAGEINRILQT